MTEKVDLLTKYRIENDDLRNEVSELKQEKLELLEKIIKSDDKLQNTYKKYVEEFEKEVKALHYIILAREIEDAEKRKEILETAQRILISQK